MSEIRNTLDGINNQLDISEEKNNTLEGTVIETIKNKAHRGNRSFFLNDKSIGSSGTMYRGSKIRTNTKFLSKTMQARR